MQPAQQTMSLPWPQPRINGQASLLEEPHTHTMLIWKRKKKNWPERINVNIDDLITEQPSWGEKSTHHGSKTRNKQHWYFHGIALQPIKYFYRCFGNSMVIPPDCKGLCGKRKMLYSIQKVDIHSPKGHGIPTQTVSPPKSGALIRHALVLFLPA